MSILPQINRYCNFNGNSKGFCKKPDVYAKQEHGTLAKKELGAGRWPTRLAVPRQEPGLRGAGEGGKGPGGRRWRCATDLEEDTGATPR